MNKLCLDYQEKFSDRLIFDNSVFDRIDESVKIHEETEGNPLSSSAACLNLLGSLSDDPPSLIKFLNSFGLNIEEIYPFPSPVTVGGRTYNDQGCVIFEWVGPKESPIFEIGGGRGQNRTSVDAYVIAKISGKLTQILIEWKFTEGESREIVLGRFCGGKGVERLKRYSSVLARLRKEKNLPFNFEEEYKKSNSNSFLGVTDFSPDHLYQLFRMTLLAKTTTPIQIGDFQIMDYRILHLSHSQNERINILEKKYLEFSPGLKQYENNELHKAWPQLLSIEERARFYSGFWNKSIRTIENKKLREYLIERYE